MHEAELQMKSDLLEKAERTLHGIARHTPILHSSLADGLFFKAENLQLTGSFKVRPAYNQMAALSSQERRRGIVTSSSGNFAQGAAFAAGRLGASIKIVMMRSCNPLKVERTRKLGGEVVFCPDRFEARRETVARIARDEGRTVVHPYDHPLAVAGNGTIAREILGQFPEVEHIAVPISGGGLIGGIAWAAKLQKPSMKIWGVQPSGSNATFLSFRSGQRQAIERAETIADGLKVTQPGEITFPLIQRYVDEIVTVGEDTILKAVGDLLWEEHLVVEPSGAVTLAAVQEGKIPVEKTVCVLSGGNIAPEVLRRVSGK